MAPGRGREVAEVVDRQRDVGGQGLADRLAVLPALGDGQHLGVGLDGVGDLLQHLAPLAGEPWFHSVGGDVGGVQGRLDVFG